MMIPSIYPVTCNTKHIGHGSTFVAIKGFKEDGYQYIQEAVARGATTIVIDKTHPKPNLPQNVHCLSVDNTRQALAELSSQALGNPASKLKFVGITGTAGKTTTTYLIEHLLHKAGFKTALLGTIKNKIDDQEELSSLTTPEGDYIQMFLAECVKKNIDYVVMEVSSHSISLNRIHGIPFIAAGFTNLSPEHLDYHQTMDHYFATKMDLFKQVTPTGTIVINGDNAWGKKAYQELSTNFHNNNIILFGAQLDNKIEKKSLFKTISKDLSGVALTLTIPKTQGTTALVCPTLFGDFNGYNITMAALICLNLGLTIEHVVNALTTFKGVPGRLQVYTLKNGAKAFVDYAHKPGAFEEVVKTLRPLSKHFIVVFGCGGDRDKTKRPVMGKLATDYADLIIVTDDNPRSEDRQAIANEILAGMLPEKRKTVIVELDRKKAIAFAAQQATPQSVIALLGKGHEPYYLIQGQKFHLDDYEEISRF